MAKSVLAKFDNRVRFNWGFYDAVQCVREGWNNAAKNFGFGSRMVVHDPEDVSKQHFDREYAVGWLFGYYEVLGGASPCESSDLAWASTVKRRVVAA